MTQWTRYKSLKCVCNVVHVLWNRWLLQIKRNRDGMAMFEKTTLSVHQQQDCGLHQAMTYGEESQIAPPSNGIHHMVLAGWNEQEKKQGRQEEGQKEIIDPRRFIRG